MKKTNEEKKSHHSDEGIEASSINSMAKSSIPSSVLQPSHSVPSKRSITTRSLKAAAEATAAAVAAAATLALESVPSTTSLSSQYYGSVKPQSLKYFLLAAQCYRQLKQSEACVMLLESCMEGPGHGGLIVPIAPVGEETYLQLWDVLSSTTSIVFSSSSSSNSSSHESIERPPVPQKKQVDEEEDTHMTTTTTLIKNSNVKKKSAVNNGHPIGGQLEMVSSQTGSSPSLISSSEDESKGKGDKVTIETKEGQKEDVDGKYKVWRIIRDMALQHSPVSIAVSVAERVKQERGVIKTTNKRERRLDDIENDDPMTSTEKERDSASTRNGNVVKNDDTHGTTIDMEMNSDYHLMEKDIQVDRVLSTYGGFVGFEKENNNTEEKWSEVVSLIHSIETREKEGGGGGGKNIYNNNSHDEFRIQSKLSNHHRQQLARLVASISDSLLDGEYIEQIPTSILALGSKNSINLYNNTSEQEKCSIENNVFGYIPVSQGKSLNIIACLCEQRGLALLATDNRNRAAQWLQAALRIDPYIQGALHALLENQLLSSKNEEGLFAYLASVLDDFEISPLHYRQQQSQQEMITSPTNLPSSFNEVFALRGLSLCLEGMIDVHDKEQEDLLTSSLDSTSKKVSEGTAQQVVEMLTSTTISTESVTLPANPSSSSSLFVPSGVSSSSSSSAQIQSPLKNAIKGKTSSSKSGASISNSSMATTPSSSSPSSSSSQRTPRGLSGRKAASSGLSSATATAAALRASAVTLTSSFMEESTASTATSSEVIHPQSLPLPPIPFQPRFSTGLGGSVNISGNSSSKVNQSVLTLPPPPLPPGGSSAGRAPIPTSPLPIQYLDEKSKNDKDVAAKAAFSANFPLQTRHSTDTAQKQTLSSLTLLIKRKPLLQRRSTGWLLDLYASRMGRYGVHSSNTASVGASRTSPSSSSSFSLSSKFSRLEKLFRLGTSIDVLAAKAENHLCAYDMSQAIVLTKQIVNRDPFHILGVTVHYACLVRLKRSSELFKLAHNAVEAAPGKALSWYAVGCYYLSLGKCSAAVRNFTRACQLEGGFAQSWMALGHSYALQDESEPALAAYRTAMRLHPASHLPPLAMVPLMQASGQVALAKQYLELAMSRCPFDPLVYHEAGVLEYNTGSFPAAASLFRVAAQSISQSPHHVRGQFEATFLNLGHATRKLNKLREAAAAYGAALSLSPGRPSTLAALAFTHQLAGDSDKASILYHSALAKVPEDLFCQRMLRLALEDSLLLQNARVVLLPLGSSVPKVAISSVRTDTKLNRSNVFEISKQQQQQQQQQGGGGGGGGGGQSTNSPRQGVRVSTPSSIVRTRAGSVTRSRNLSTFTTTKSTLISALSSSSSPTSSSQSQQHPQSIVRQPVILESQIHSESGLASSTPEYQRALSLSRDHVSTVAASIVYASSSSNRTSSSSSSQHHLSAQQARRESRRAHSAGPNSDLSTPRTGRGRRVGQGRERGVDAVAVSTGGLIFYPGGHVIDHSSSTSASSSIAHSARRNEEEDEEAVQQQQQQQTDDDWIINDDDEEEDVEEDDDDEEEEEEEEEDMVLDDSEEGDITTGTGLDIPERSTQRIPPIIDGHPRRRRRNRTSGTHSSSASAAATVGGHRRSSGGGSTIMSSGEGEGGLEIETDIATISGNGESDNDDNEEEEEEEEDADGMEREDDEGFDDDVIDEMEIGNDDEEEEVANALHSATISPSAHLSASDRLEIASAAAASGDINADADFAALLQQLEVEAAAEEEEAELLRQSQEIDAMDTGEDGRGGARRVQGMD